MGIQLITFFTQPAIIRRSLHMFYHPKTGGVPLNTREITLVCRYAKEEISIAQLVQTSFDIFLRKELQNVAKYLCASV